MAKRFTDTDKYKKEFIRSLPAAYKIFWDYLYLDCDFAGIWEVDFEVAQIRVGKDAPIEKEEALRLFNAGEERIVVLNHGSKWLVKPFIDFQYGELDPKNRVHFSVLEKLRKFEIKGLASPLQGAKDKDKYKDKDKDKEKDKEGTLQIATLTLKTSFLEQKKAIYPMLDIEGEIRKCVDWFTTKGVKIKSWEKAITNWLKKSYDQRGIISDKVESKLKPVDKSCKLCNGTGWVYSEFKSGNVPCSCRVKG